MKLLSLGKDGGIESTVWGFWFIEIKKLFSCCLLLFLNGSREAYHSHAFNSISWILWGQLSEYIKDSPVVNVYKPSILPIKTRTSTFHKVISTGNSLVFSLRGPWAATWDEYTDHAYTLTHGRQTYG